MEENKNTADLQQEPENGGVIVQSEAGVVPGEYYKHVGLEDAEAFIRANLQSAARNVISIGYYLKHIRDNELYLEAGYKDIWEYARERYGFSMSSASRYMTRNDKFSQGGNSPIMDERYREYSKSQLQEMLSLSDEQMSQVTPDMTVQQIRQMRQPKEIPYFELDGQRDLEADFPEIFPQEESAGPMPETALAEKSESFTLSIGDLVGGDDGELEPVVPIATSQKQVDPESRRQYCEVSQSECETIKRLDSMGTWQQENCMFLRPELMTGTSELNPCCRRCEHNEFCLHACDRCNDTANITDNLAAQTQQNLDDCCADAAEENTEENHSGEITEMVESEQQELPMLKNNDQRAAFIDSYATWPLWIEIKETGEKYYRYDLPNGNSFVVKTYHCLLFDYYSTVDSKSRYCEGDGHEEYYYLVEPKFFYDCKTNRSYLIEILKELQKAGDQS
ncbi:MAG: hypothetical protein PHV18_15415 [Lachnospiraceae bacterium]|nr:hypothetical protein [Lachnospiraceae bacterium]